MTKTPSEPCPDKPLHVFLRGDRNYVQATQIIARLAEQVAPEGSQLTQATFNQITANTVSWIACDSGDADRLIGQIHFAKDDQVQVFWLLDTGEPAPRLSTGMNLRLELVTTPSPLAGQYQFHTTADLESRLNVMVQAVKALHENLAPSVRDVWFTGMRQFALPVKDQPAPIRGVIDIQHRRLIKRGHQYQSLVDVVMTDHDGRPSHQGVFNFAFKSELSIHVD